jgi:hypothetical protein
MLRRCAATSPLTCDSSCTARASAGGASIASSRQLHAVSIEPLATAVRTCCKVRISCSSLQPFVGSVWCRFCSSSARELDDAAQESLECKDCSCSSCSSLAAAADMSAAVLADNEARACGLLMKSLSFVAGNIGWLSVMLRKTIRGGW